MALGGYQNSKAVHAFLTCNNWVALFTAGEVFLNNHHDQPATARLKGALLISGMYAAWRLTFNASRYRVILLIRTFRSKETEKIFNRQRSDRLPQDIQQVALRKLRMLNRAVTIQDLRVPPANRLEKLSGNRASQHSIRINDQWRVCFRWESGAHDVEIVDYH